MPQILTVTWGEQTFSPISYHSFKTGAITLQVSVPEGTTLEQAHGAAMATLRQLAERQFKQELQAFLENTKLAAAGVAAAKGR